MSIKTKNILDLKSRGYQGFIRIGELKNNYSVLPGKSGVYIVLTPNDFVLKFMNDGSKNSDVTLDSLKMNWVDDARILYIGSSSNLKKRIKQLIESRNSSVVSIPSAKYLWKLKESQDLLIAWNAIEINECKQEMKLLFQDFTNHYGKLPFANRQEISGSEEKGQKDTARMISHNIRPNIFNLQSTIKSLETYLSRKGILDDNIDEINNEFNADTDIDIETDFHAKPEKVSHVIKRLNGYLDKIQGIITKTNKYITVDLDIEDFDFYDLKPMMIEFIKNKKIEYGDKYEFRLKCEDTDCFIHKPTFLEMLDQLIQNSHMHAFKGHNYKRKIIEIEAFDKDNNLIIKFRNNGAKFEFTEEEFFQLGFKGINSSGQGSGGNFIKNVVEKHCGIFKIKPKNRGTEFVITINYGHLMGGEGR